VVSAYTPEDPGSIPPHHVTIFFSLNDITRLQLSRTKTQGLRNRSPEALIATVNQSRRQDRDAVENLRSLQPFFFNPSY